MTLRAAAAYGTTIRIGPVTGYDAGSLVDVSGDAVSVAFVPEGTVPGTLAWKSALWDVNPNGPVYKAQYTIGANELTAGTYEVWLRFIHGGRTEAQMVGRLVMA